MGKNRRSKIGKKKVMAPQPGQKNPPEKTMKTAGKFVAALFLGAVLYFARKDIARAMDTDTDRMTPERVQLLINLNKGAYPYLKDLPTSLVMAMVEVESNFDPNAASQVSAAAGGPAKGLMQVKQGTYDWMVEMFGFRDDGIYNPTSNLLAGMHYLALNIEETGTIEDGILAYYDGLGGWKAGKRNWGYLAKVMERQARWVV